PPHRRAGESALSPGSTRGLHPRYRPGSQAAPATLRPALTHRGDGTGPGHERLGVPSPLQSGHCTQSLTIPEAVAAPGGSSSDALGRPRRHECGLSCRLPGRLLLQSRIQKPLWHLTHARCTTAARRNARLLWAMRKTTFYTMISTTSPSSTG